MSIHFDQLHSEIKNLLSKYYTLNVLKNENIIIKNNKILSLENKKEFIYFPDSLEDKIYDLPIEDNQDNELSNREIVDSEYNQSFQELSNKDYSENKKHIHYNFSNLQHIHSNILKTLSFYYDMNNIEIIKHNNHKFEIITNNKYKSIDNNENNNIKNNNHLSKYSEFFYNYEESNLTIAEYYEILYENIGKKQKFALFLQVGNFQTFQKMEDYLVNFNQIDVNIFIVIVKEEVNDKNISIIKELFPSCTIIKTLNKGMDVGLFLINLLYIRHKNLEYKYILKLHTKTDDRFRNNILTNLCKNKKQIENCLSMIQDNNIGMITGNKVFNFKNNKDFFNNHYYYLTYLINYIYQKDLDYNFLEFAPGTFFYSKFNVFDKLDEINIRFIYDKLNDNDSLDINWYKIFYNLPKLNQNEVKEHFYYHPNNYGNNLYMQCKTNCSGMRDFMLEHALERFFGYLAKYQNYKILKI